MSMGSRRRGLAPTAAALLLLLSLGTQHHHAASATSAMDSQTAHDGRRVLASSSPRQRNDQLQNMLDKLATHSTNAVESDVAKRKRRMKRRLGKTTGHKTHHHGGGKHDAGTNGHHVAGNKNDGGGGGSAKSGKAGATSNNGVAKVDTLVNTPEVVTSDEDDEEAATTTTVDDGEDEEATTAEDTTEDATPESEEIDESHDSGDDNGDDTSMAASFVSNNGAKAGKSSGGGHGSDYASADESSGHSVDSPPSDGGHSGKSGKVSTSGGHSSGGHSSGGHWSGSAKSGKATGDHYSSSGGHSGKSGKVSTDGHWSSDTNHKGSDTKSGKSATGDMSYDMSYATKEEKGEVVKGETKPKAEKEGPLTNAVFIKEKGHVHDGHWSVDNAKSGKSAGDHGTGGHGSGKSGKTTGVGGGYSGKATSDHGSGGGSGKASKDPNHDGGSWSGKASKNPSGSGGGGGDHNQSGKASKAGSDMSYPATTTSATEQPPDEGEPDDDTAPTPPDTNNPPSPTPEVNPPPTPVADPQPPTPAVVETPEPTPQPTEQTLSALLTLTPTPAPMAVEPGSETPPSDDGSTPETPPSDDGSVAGLPDPNAKYWPKADGDLRTCEFSSDFPPEYAGGPIQLLFDTRDGCCAAFPEACPTEEEISKSPPAGVRDDFTSEDEESDYPTYSPTMNPIMSEEEAMQSMSATTAGEKVAALEPFGLKFFASEAQPNFDEDVVTKVTMDHIVHSFRNNNWQVDTLDLMVLNEERRLMHESALMASPTTLRYLEEHPIYELIFGGVLHFTQGVAVPTAEQIEQIVEDSFAGERLAYYLNLLTEEEQDVSKVAFDNNLQPNGVEGTSQGTSEGFNWSGLFVGMSCALGGVGLLAAGSRYYYKNHRSLSIDELGLDLEKGDYNDYAIRLQYTNDEIEAFPGSTVGETATQDALSVPSLVRGEEEIDFSTPGGTLSAKRSLNGELGEISPLESPRGTKGNNNSNSPGSTSTRYISVFTVKKDCGNKSLEEVDLRALAIAYLSRMLKKFPNTHLLPYDKESDLPAITNIRNIPDDLEDLSQYVGNARVDDKTGKILFNLRVESDEPVSKMKTNSRRGVDPKFRAKKYTAAPADVAPPPKKVEAEEDAEIKEGGSKEEEDGGPVPSDSPKSPKSPKSPGVMEDVEL